MPITANGVTYTDEMIRQGYAGLAKDPDSIGKAAAKYGLTAAQTAEMVNIGRSQPGYQTEQGVNTYIAQHPGQVSSGIGVDTATGKLLDLSSPASSINANYTQAAPSALYGTSGYVPKTTNPTSPTQVSPSQIPTVTAPVIQPSTSVLSGSGVYNQLPELKPAPSYVSPQSMVSNQLKTLLTDGSPLQTLAENRAKEQANRMGLLSSSMAVGAGQKALYDVATPIATTDASRYAAADLSQQTALQNERYAGLGGNIASVLQGQQDQAALQRLREQEIATTNRQTQAETASIYQNQQDINAAADRIGITAQWNMSETSQKMTADALTNFNAKVADIQATPDSQMNPAAKTAAIKDLTTGTKNVFLAAKAYDSMANVVSSWEPEPSSILAPVSKPIVGSTPTTQTTPNHIEVARITYGNDFADWYINQLNSPVKSSRLGVPKVTTTTPLQQAYQQYLNVTNV